MLCVWGAWIGLGTDAVGGNPKGKNQPYCKVQAVFDLLYAFRDDVSRVTGVRMPSGMDPQYPYRQAETEASLAQILSDQQAPAWRTHELWQRDAATTGIHSQEAAASLRHL